MPGFSESPINIKTEVFNIVLKHSVVENFVDIQDDISLIDDLKYDSLNFIELVLELESTFAIEIDDDELMIDTFSTPRKILELVQSKLG